MLLLSEVCVCVCGRNLALSSSDSIFSWQPFSNARPVCVCVWVCVFSCIITVQVYFNDFFSPI